MSKKKSLLKGISASPGKVKGKVRIILNPSGIGKMRKGDILVTGMTNPLFVPAMGKAAAVVTDVGGITCHAAIVSRELSIPCVVGARQATKILKDGMEVLVDGESGEVFG